jgi:dihydrofolate reductase
MIGGESSAAPPRDASANNTRDTLELVVAVAANGVIGRGGTLPWHLPDDLKHFKTLTMGHAILMGRRTYESIGKPLPGRRSIVVSTTMSQPPAPGVDIARSLDEAVAIAKQKSPGPAFVIGGAAMYDAALPRADVLHVTELDDALDGDTLFRPIDKSQWRMVQEQRHERDERHAHAFWFRTYVRSTKGK